MSEAKNNGRGFFKKSDVIIIAVVLGLAAGAMLGLKIYQSTTAQDDMWAILTTPKQDYRISLSPHKDGIIDIFPVAGIHAKAQITDGSIRFIEVDCPDHICEGYGYLSGSYDMAVCMPNKMALTVYSGEEISSRMEDTLEIGIAP